MSIRIQPITQRRTIALREFLKPSHMSITAPTKGDVIPKIKKLKTKKHKIENQMCALIFR